MTVLIAVNQKDKIILGADSCTFRGYNKIDLNNHKGRSKIEQINDIIFCSTGRVAEINNFLLYCSTRKPESNSLISIQRFFNEFGTYLTEMVKKELQIENNYFLVYKEKLFCYNNGAVNEILIDDYATLGAGWLEAYTALYLGKTAREAIQVSIDLNVYAGGEPQVLEITKTTFNKIDGSKEGSTYTFHKKVTTV